MSTLQQSILNKNRKDKFLLVLTLPSILKDRNKIDANDRASEFFSLDSIQYSIYGTVVPAISIPDIDVPYGAQVSKVTSYARPAWTSVTVNFTVDNSYNNWWVLWYWLDLINNSTEGTFNYNNLIGTDSIAKKTTQYQSNITVYGLDEYNNKKIQFDYLHSFITGLGDLTYSYREAGEIESSFTFAFGQLETKLL